MAIAYQSYNVASSAAASNTIVVTKPTGLSVGDLMVASVVFKQDVGGGTNVSAEADWQTLERKSSPTENQGVTSYIFYKVADADDAAATNFTFTLTTSSLRRTAMVARFTGQRVASPVSIYASASSNGSGTTLTVGTSTPAYKNSMALFFTAVLNNTTVSSQAFANDNPTLTEIHDTGAVEISSAVAYGTRLAMTATGDCTATMSNSGLKWVGQVVYINPEPTTNTVAETITLVEAKLQKIESAILEILSTSEVVVQVKNIWHNITKNVSTWINQDKS